MAVDEVSKYYEVPYSQTALDVKRVTAWQDDNSARTAMHLPAPNEFIAEDVSLVALAADRPASPQVALDTERQKIWFMPDAEFRVPQGVTYINFRSPEVGQNAPQAALVALYTALL